MCKPTRTKCLRSHHPACPLFPQSAGSYELLSYFGIERDFDVFSCKSEQLWTTYWQSEFVTVLYLTSVFRLNLITLCSRKIFGILLNINSIQWVPWILSLGVKRGRGVTLITHPHLVPRSRMSRSYTPLPPSASMACSGTALLFTLLFCTSLFCRNL
jgi:hypothetical protein